MCGMPFNESGFRKTQLCSDIQHQFFFRKIVRIKHHHSRRISAKGFICECVNDIVSHIVSIVESFIVLYHSANIRWISASNASGDTIGSKRRMVLPSLETRNLPKFHLMASPFSKPVPVFWWIMSSWAAKAS